MMRSKQPSNRQIDESLQDISNCKQFVVSCSSAVVLEIIAFEKRSCPGGEIDTYLPPGLYYGIIKNSHFEKSH